MNYFTPHAIQKLMKSYGLGMIHLSVDYMPGYRVANGFPMIRAVFSKDFGEDEAISSVFSAMDVMQNYMRYSIKMFDKINGILDRISDECNIVIWGASFQLERLLAYTDINRKNVVAIVDNSVARQKLSFSLGDKVVAVSSPSILQTIPVEKILISTWNNWHPIYKQIESMGLKIDIIPLYE